jgi:hypothetical protein
MIASDLSVETRAVAEVLKSTSYGEIIPFAALSAAIGRDIKARRWVILAGMRVALRESGAAFAAVRGVGYRRLTAEELPSLGSTARTRIRRIASRGQKALEESARSFNDLPENTKRDVLKEQTALGMIAMLSRDKSLPATPDNADRPLPPALALQDTIKHLGMLP